MKHRAKEDGEAASDLKGEDLGVSVPPGRSHHVSSSPLSERMRVVVSSRHRRDATVSLASYDAALQAIQPHLKLLTDDENGIPVSEEALRKAERLTRFYEEIIETYEQQFAQREHPSPG